MKKKKVWPRILIAVIVLIVAAAVIIKMSAPASAKYQETAAKEGTLSTYYSFTGTLTARRTQTATAAQPDTVKEIYVLAGDKVKKNDRLIRLSSGEIIRALIDGEITSVSVHAEDQVMAGAVLLTLADLENLEVTLKVDEYDVAAVAPGAKAELSVPAAGVKTSGTVETLNKLATQTPTNTYYEATVSIDYTPGMLPGMEVGVTLLKAKAENAVLLKMDALKFGDDNQPYVLVMDGQDEITAREVTVGISDGSYAQIKSGLSAGEKVYYSTNSFEDIYSFMQSRRSGK